MRSQSTPIAQTGKRPRRAPAAHGIWFQAPADTWHADAPLARVRGRLGDGSLGDAVRAYFAGPQRSGQRVAGALPFDRDAGATLFAFMPRAASRHHPRHDGRVLRAHPQLEVVAHSHAPGRARYCDAVRQVRTAIAAGTLDKAVLGRTCTLSLATSPDPESLLARLCARASAPYRFMVPTGDGAWLLGASPELLIARRGRRVLAHPMAGSIPRSTDPTEDTIRRDGLARSSKDLHEHRLVIDDYRAALAPLTSALHIDGAPQVIATETMWHLATRVEGELSSEATSILDLVHALHPTAAVGGTPRAAATPRIHALEDFVRGPFGGAVGYCDASGDGTFAVSIRCAELRADQLRLFAGAGIVGDSDPDTEYAETEAKLATMLEVLGLRVPEAKR